FRSSLGRRPPRRASFDRQSTGAELMHRKQLTTHGARTSDLAALRSTRAIEIDSCAPAHIDLSVSPSMSLASPRLIHSLPALARCYPRNFTFYVADPISSIRGKSPLTLNVTISRPVSLAPLG